MHFRPGVGQEQVLLVGGPDWQTLLCDQDRGTRRLGQDRPVPLCVFNGVAGWLGVPTGVIVTKRPTSREADRAAPQPRALIRKAEEQIVYVGVVDGHKARRRGPQRLRDRNRCRRCGDGSKLSLGGREPNNDRRIWVRRHRNPEADTPP